MNRSAKVEPLLKTRWGQTNPYRYYTPGNDAPGSTAVAMGQIMKYYNFPDTGRGSHSYIEPTYGVQSTNFGEIEFRWNRMPQTLTNRSRRSSKQSLGFLLAQLGIAFESEYDENFTFEGSMSHVLDATKQFFKYSENMQVIKRNNYRSITDWERVLKAELDEGRPICYSSYTTNNVETFVIDGYDENGLIHVNWGKNGYLNGYFSLNDLSSSFGNQFTSAIIGIEPGNDGSDLKLASDVSIIDGAYPDQAVVYHDRGFIASALVKNKGTEFVGTIVGRVFDESGQMVYNFPFEGDLQRGGDQYIEENGELDIEAYIDFGLTLLPGTYVLKIYASSDDENFLCLDHEGYIGGNEVEFEISKGSDKGIVLSREISVAPILFKREAFDVAIRIRNNDNERFVGKIAIRLHNLDGSAVLTLGEVSRRIAERGTRTIVFSYPGILREGPYKIAVWKKVNGGDWEIIDDGLFLGVKKVDVLNRSLRGAGSQEQITSSQKETVDVFPNPSNGLIRVSGTNLGQLTVHTLDGKQVKEISLGNSSPVNLSDLGKGTYLLRVYKLDGSMETKKLILSN